MRPFSGTRFPASTSRPLQVSRCCSAPRMWWWTRSSTSCKAWRIHACAF